MRGLFERRMRRRWFVGALLALSLVVACWPAPAHAAPAWKDAIADIEEIRDTALSDLYDVGAEFTGFLEDEPSAGDAVEEYHRTLADLQAVGRDATGEINAVMDQFPDRQAVQDVGTLAKGLINAAEAFSENYAAFQLNDYLEQLEGTPPPPSPTTTTMATTSTTIISPTTTSTTVVPTTTAPVPTTTTTTTATSSPTTTTTASASVTTTTTGPAATTTTTTAARTRSTTTTSTTVGNGGDVLSPGDGDTGSSATPSREEVPLKLRGGDEDYLAAGPGATSSTGSFLEPGLSVSLSRVLEPLLPAPVTDVVVSPLFMLELLWRAITSSGQGLVAPISLLLFSLLSLLRDRRRVNLETAETPG